MIMIRAVHRTLCAAHCFYSSDVSLCEVDRVMNMTYIEKRIQCKKRRGAYYGYYGACKNQK